MRTKRFATCPPRAIVLAAVVLFVPSVVVSQGISPEQVVSIEQVSSVAMRPDGGHVAYTLSKPRGSGDPRGGNYSELWLVAQESNSPQRIIAAPQSAFGPTWSPDGSMLAFRANLDQHENTQVYAVTVEDHTPRLLTRSPTAVSSFQFAPDGRSIAYTTRDPMSEAERTRRAQGHDQWVAGEDFWRHVRLWIEDLTTGDRRAVTPEGRTVWAFAWAPGSDRLAVQTTSSPDIDHGYMFRQLATVSATGGALRPLTETPGKLGGMAWSPDGKRLAFIGAISQNDPLAQSIFVAPVASGIAVNRTLDYEGSVTWVGWQDGRTLLFLATEGTATAINRLRADQGEIERLVGGGVEVFTSVSFDGRMRNFAAVTSTAAHPSELYVGDVRRGRMERVTRHNPWLDNVQLARQEAIEWWAEDGTRIEGVLVRPLNEEPGMRYPLAILPHGGPEGISRDGWNTRGLYPAQVLAARGYAVLMPNYRGSGGRGVAFSKADHRDLGGKEFEDVIAGIDYLADQGLVDPDRVGSSGTSYGGYFSAWAATRYPDRFAAGISFAGISNWVSFTGTTDIPYEMSLVHWDMWWFDDPGLAWDRSPMARIDERTSPLLVGHGAADARVHPEQSLELYTTLKINKIATELVIYPREPHGLREPAHLLDFMRRIIGWFDEHVKAAVPATM
ncbi:MAG: S9 family peptidase [Gemmatimonadetes bacterium]|nr:S9 family peptidase [Gemmatimonadota bacterium]